MLWSMNHVECVTAVGAVRAIASRAAPFAGRSNRSPANPRAFAKRDLARVLACLCFSVQATAALAQQQPPTTIYAEDFQNDQAANIASIIKVDSYAGAAGETYTASPAWLTNCNGWLSAWNQDSNPAAATANGECNDRVSWNNVQQLAEALGMLNGGTTGSGGTARDNLSVSAYTQANPPAAPNNIEIQSSQIALNGSDRFLIFGADVAAVNCDIAAHPMLQFYAVDASNTAVAAGGQVDGCSGTSFTAEAIGSASAVTIKAGHYTSGAILVSGSSTSIRVNNMTFTGGGNDHAFDNLLIQDVTPTLSKAFGTSSTSPNTAVTLTFTVNNTTDNLQKQGWSFTDDLPAGLTIADSTVASTCTGTTVAVTPGGSSIAITDGNLPAGPSCTITVNVIAAAAGSYTNGASNISAAIGMNPPPAPATLVVGGGTAPVDLAIAKTGSATAEAGGALSWTLTVTNNGTNPSSGFVVTDTVPAGVTNVASPTAGCTVSGSTVTCVGDALAVNASATITITGNAPSPFTTCISNSASVLGNEADPSSANDSASFQTCPPASSASITTAKALTAINGAAPAAGQPVNAGDVLTYTITSTNAGQAAGATTLTETVPASTTYAGPDASAWSGCAPGAASPAQCTTVQNVPANGSTSTTFTISALASDARSITNVVTSSADPACAACTVTVPLVPAQPGAGPVPAPVNSTWMQLLLGLCLLIVGGGIAYRPSR